MSTIHSNLSWFIQHLKQGINKAGVLGSTCPLRAVCQSGRGNIWAPERCLTALTGCWRDSLVDIVNPELQAKKVVRTKVAIQHSKEKSIKRLQSYIKNLEATYCMWVMLFFKQILGSNFRWNLMWESAYIRAFFSIVCHLFAYIFVLSQEILIRMYSH